MSYSPLIDLLASRSGSFNTPSITLNTPLNAALVNSLTPTLNFTGIAALSSQNIEYEIQIDTVNTFNSVSGSPLIDAVSYSTPMVQTYSSSTTWVCPAGVTSIQVEAWGGGGGAGGYNGSLGAPGGGGGGAYAKTNSVTVTPGNTYNINVGIGGTGGTDGTGSNAAAGGDSGFDGNTAILAKGGAKGNAGNPGSGGAGGTTAASIGDTKFAGGSGAAGSGSTAGGGGGGAGSLAAGASASGITHGNGGSPDGGNGGDGSGTGTGSAGSTLGGGGGASSWSAGAGGAGAGGQVKLTYNVPATAGFADITNGSNVDPFPSGDQIGYTVQTSLTAGTTYYWRVRQKVQLGNVNYYSGWSSTFSFVPSLGPTPSVSDSVTTSESVTVVVVLGTPPDLGVSIAPSQVTYRINSVKVV